MGSYAYKYCMCFTRKFRSPEAQPPPDVRAAFSSASGGAGGGGLSGDGLRRFLAGAQGEAPADAERVARLVAAAAAAAGGGGGGVSRLVRAPQPAPLSLEEFFNFLFSAELNPPIRSEVHHDMSAPLSHYYIYTGHNSYLTGNQLNSDSSDVPIIKALQRGVRVIELDMWPNAAKDNVDILHGRTLTAPVELITCLKSIKEYAFCASVFPLVITLEDHLTPDLQAKVAEMLIETFEDLLYVPGPEPLKEFPSPEALIKRIIISTKPPKEYKEFLEAKDSKNISEIRNNLAEEECLRRETTYSDPEECDEKDEQDYQEEEDTEEDDPNFEEDIADQYRKLITIQAGKPKGHLKDSLQVDPDKVRRISLSETQLAKATACHGADVIRFTQKNLLRVYPKGTRINSSNFDPFDAWTHGAQMVACNMQGHDKAFRLMQGFFRANGGCGYVKKPDFLLKIDPDGKVFDPTASLPVKKTLKVKVYMGDGWRMDFSKTHFDAFSPPDFYTRVGIAGVPADTVMKKTRTMEDQWVPVWDEEFTFPLTVPELALLRIEVQEYDMTEKPDFGGQTCLPVSELKRGIRAVPLHDRKGNQYKSVRLLMRFDFV